MYLTGMTHREELFELTVRWLNGDLAPDDGETISRIFLYESAVCAVVVDRMIDFLGKLFKSPLRLERVRRKQALHRRLIEYLPHPGERTRELIERFEADPEYFFPRVPIDAMLVTTPAPKLVTIRRIKRLSRVAEKVSFRMVDALFKEIQAEARRIAGQRAAAAGVALSDLVSSASRMQSDFAVAEQTVAARFRRGNLRISREDLTVNDLLGFKIIGEPELLEQVPALLERAAGIRLLETETHTGDYNAVNLLVEIALPPPDGTVARLKGFDWSLARRRGLNPDAAKEGFRDYLATGVHTVRIKKSS